MVNFWFETPRALGIPSQIIYHSEDELKREIDFYNHRFPIYLTHNSFNTVENNIPLSMNFLFAFLDFDSADKPENAYNDAMLSSMFLQNMNIKHYISFSGGKGFHIFIMFKKTVEKVDEQLRRKIILVQDWVTTLGYTVQRLRTFDPLVRGDFRRLCRIWYSQYIKIDKITGKRTTTNYNCIPLDYDLFMCRDIHRIWTKSKSITGNILLNLEYSDTVFDGDTYTLDELIHGFELHDVDSDLMPKYSVDSFKKFDGFVSEDLFNEVNMYMQCPSMTRLMLLPNPPHPVRWYCANRLREAGFEESETVSFIVNLRWLDKHRMCGSKTMTEYQVENIYKKSYPTWNCKRKKLEGMCFDKSCKFNIGD